MRKQFDVPEFYRANGIGTLKMARRRLDPRRKDFSPTRIECGRVHFSIARHFGFCYGVENAIDIAYKAVRDNPDKRIFLLSEMIHNPGVNEDLQHRGVRFLMDTKGNTLTPFEELNRDDIVIVPAFGTTVEIQNTLRERGIDPYFHDTTCPFVEKVWKRAAQLGEEDATVIIHGKRAHEETRATFSHSRQNAPTLVVKDIDDTRRLIQFILGEITRDEFDDAFSKSVSAGFDPERHLEKIGVINQTTMLATETQEIATELRKAMAKRYGEENLSQHFVDTRDTLCYATYENQNATRELIKEPADIGIVVGGYNSSNTSHLVELMEPLMPTFYIRDKNEILDAQTIRHFDMHQKEIRTSEHWLPLNKNPLVVAITSGASCPDVSVEGVIERVLEFFEDGSSFAKSVMEFEAGIDNQIPQEKTQSQTANV